MPFPPLYLRLFPSMCQLWPRMPASQVRIALQPIVGMLSVRGTHY